MSEQRVIICDLDGTLFNCEWRRKKYLTGDKKYFDAFNAAHVEDKVVEPISMLIDMFGRNSCYDYYGLCDFNFKIPSVIFVSGREDKHIETTKKQIEENFNGEDFYYKLFMRQTGDYREDEVIKKEIYENHIKDKYDVLFCIDDRPKVCRMWRDRNFRKINKIQNCEICGKKICNQNVTNLCRSCGVKKSWTIRKTK